MYNSIHFQWNKSEEARKIQQKIRKPHNIIDQIALW